METCSKISNRQRLLFLRLPAIIKYAEAAPSHKPLKKTPCFLAGCFFYFVTCASPAPIIKKQTQKKTKFIIKPFSFRTVKNLSMIYPLS